jgi:heme A synthase
MKVLLVLITTILLVFGAGCAWAWLICLGRGAPRDVARTPAIAAAALVTIALMLIAGAAYAHGDAQWIADNKRYVDEAGAHCCGVADCRRDQAAKFRESDAGVWVTTGAGAEVLVPRRLVGRGLYPSIDDWWWICIRGGEIKCVFKPTGGT